MSDIHDERSDTTNEQTEDNLEVPSTEVQITSIVSDITRNVSNKPAQDNMKKVGLLQQRINVLTGARDTGIAKDNVMLNKRTERRRKMFKEKKRECQMCKKISSQRKTLES